MQKEQPPQPLHFPSFEEFKKLPDSQEAHLFSVSLPEVKGHLRFFKLDHLSLSDGHLEIADKATARHGGLRHFNELPLVEMNFVMEGHIIQRQGHLPGEIHFVKGYHNIMYNEGEWEHNRCIGGGIHNTFTISIFTERFLQLFATHSRQMDNIAEKILRREPFLVERPDHLYTPYMSSMIEALWNCPLNGSLKSLYMETRMMELFSLQWETFSQTLSSEISLRKEDREKLLLAREILQNNLLDPPGLRQLSLLCGLNEFKLKKGFKEMFGDTVFGLFNRMRLEQAMLQIRDTNRSIAEIACETGWANPQHFSRAFKKHFGITPGQARR